MPQGEPDLTRWYLKSPGFAKPSHHVHILEFNEQAIAVTALGLDRTVLDQYSVESKLAPVE